MSNFFSFLKEKGTRRRMLYQLGRTFRKIAIIFFFFGLFGVMSNGTFGLNEGELLITQTRATLFMIGGGMLYILGLHLSTKHGQGTSADTAKKNNRPKSN